MENELTKELADILKETGELLRGSPEEQAVVARQSVRRIEELTKDSDNRHLIHLSYFLSVYVNDVWSNFAVDSSYREEIKDEDVRRVLSRIGDEFIKIGEYLIAEDYYGCYNVYVNLVYDYLKDIKYIQERLSGGVI